MDQIIPFYFQGSQVRTLKDENGQPLFVATDVASVLGYERPENAVARHCADSLKRGVRNSRGEMRPTDCIYEPDVYAMIFGSKLPSAKKFQRWVFEEVLPSLRRDGYFRTDRKYNMEFPFDMPAMTRQFSAGLTYLERSGVPKHRAVAMSNRMVAEVTGIDVLEMLGAKEEALAENPKVAQFWNIYEAVCLDEKGNNILNHSKDDAYIALNLNHFIDVAAENGFDVPEGVKSALKTSVDRRFVETKPVNSRITGGTVRCWVFCTSNPDLVDFQNERRLRLVEEDTE
ncbi:hypothetical protein NCG89_00675 [Spongiibacter taiwanensis]|uniref:BRO-N domain-containing protein n=1 Tax=Spongiibacter taiwanensis TaxID=1748242 RepID=UPI00203532DA|nr:BRO family protein [Spongiibacter taiwanensis]USA43316.1 hypothetical protein NCG89_00675 [Spongiibacter taiwanensis]